jgi:hypothetical protein
MFACCRRYNMIPKFWMLFVSIFLLTFSSIATDQPVVLSDASKTWMVDVNLRSVIYLPTPRPIQDVFFMMNDTTPDMVYRVEKAQTEDPKNLEKMAYASTEAIPPDPYKLTPNALGPFPKGKALGFTMGDWLAASGKGTYIEEDGNATMNFTFTKLVPKGTYSIWCHRVTMPPNYECEYLPCGAPDGSENIFMADETGNGTFKLKLKALPPSTNVTFPDYAAMYVTKTAPVSRNITWTLITVAYHSDGQTHGPTPGDLGKNVHMQLVHLMYPRPARSYEEWKGVASVATAAQVQPKQAGSGGILALTAILATAYLISGRKR